MKMKNNLTDKLPQCGKCGCADMIVKFSGYVEAKFQFVNGKPFLIFDDMHDHQEITSVNCEKCDAKVSTDYSAVTPVTAEGMV